MHRRRRKGDGRRFSIVAAPERFHERQRARLQSRQPARCEHPRSSRKASAARGRARRLAIARSSLCQHRRDWKARGLGSARRWSLPHRADQDDDGTNVDLSAEKTHGRWCQRPSASITITAEAEPAAVLLGRVTQAAPRCSRVIGTMQATAARGPPPSSAFGQVFVDRQRERPETPSVV